MRKTLYKLAIGSVASVFAIAPIPVTAGNCEGQYLSDMEACAGDSVCENEAAVAYSACLATLSEELPDCDRPNSCNPE